MSDVLWLVYLAGVVEAVRGVATGTLIAIVFGVLIGTPVVGLALNLGPHEVFPRMKGFIKPAVVTVTAAVTVLVFMPSKSLLYMVAGLIGGQEVAQTEIAQKAYRVLDSKLDELLGEIPE